MFGISAAELLVILLVAVLVIPARMWPDVARGVAKVIKFVRKIIWKLTDATEEIQRQIDIEKPIDDLIKTTTEDVLRDFSVPSKNKRKTRHKSSKSARGTK